MRQNPPIRMRDMLRDGIRGVGGSGWPWASMSWAAAGMGVLACLLCLSVSARAEEAPGTIQLYEQPLVGQLGPGATGADGEVWLTGGVAEAIYRVDDNGTLRKFSGGLNAGSRPTSIAAGPDGALWFADDGTTPAIGELKPDGEAPEAPEIIEYQLPAASHPVQIAAGPEGNMWFTDDGGEPAIGEIDPSGEIKEFPTRSGSHPAGIAAGPDGDIWFTDDAGKAAIGRLAPQAPAEVVEFEGLDEGSVPGAIVAGSEGALWFADDGTKPAIGKVTPGGETPTIEELSVGLQAGSQPRGISTGAAGNVWFTDPGALSPELGKVSPAGVLSESTTGLGNEDELGEGLAAGADGRLWFALASSGAGSIAAVSVGAPAGEVSPAVEGSGVTGSPESCAGASWPRWNGAEPSTTALAFDGYSWLLDGSPIAGAGSDTY